MKWIKRIFLFIIIFIVLAIGAVVIIGTQYQDKVVDFVKNELGKQLTREVKVGAIEYSLFSNFPNVSVDLVNLETHSFKQGDTPFLKLNKVHLVFDIIPLIQGDFEVGEIILEEGEVNVIYNKAGEPNYNIVKQSSDSTASSTSFSIDNIHLQNVNVAYSDQKKDENYKLKFSECDITPNSLVDSINTSISFVGEIPELKVNSFKIQKAIALDGDFTLKVNKGAIVFDYEGKFGTGESRIIGGIKPINKEEDWDIKVALVNQSVQELVALLPEEFKDEVLSSLKGRVSGDFIMLGKKSDKKMPPIKIGFNLSGGSFIIDEHKFSKVHLKGDYSQPIATSIKGAMVNLKSYSASYNGIGVKGAGTIKDLRRPFISATIQSDFDLNKLQELALKEEFKTLNGKAHLDMKLSGRLKEVFVDKNKKAIKVFKSDGDLILESVVAQPSDFDYPIHISKGKLAFNGNNLLLDSFEGNLLSSNFSMDGQIKNYLKTIFEDQPLMFDADLKMDKMILEEFIGETNSSDSSNSNVEYQFNLPQSISLNTNLQLGSFTFRKFKAKDISGSMKLEDRILSFHELDMKTCDGKALFNGSISTKRPNKVVYKCKSNFTDIDAKQAFEQFENFGQDVLLKRHVNGRIYLKTLLIAESDKHLNLDENKIYTETKLKIKDGELVQFEPLVELQVFMKEEFKLNFNLEHLKFSTLENDIEINHGVIDIPEMAIRSSDINLDVEGTHSFNQDIDYLLKIKHNEIFKANKQNKIDAEFGVIENNDKTATLPIRMKGNMDDPKFSYDLKTKRSLISGTWKKEGKEIKKVLQDEIGGLFKNKKDKPKDDKKIEDLNNGPNKTTTELIWDEDEEDDEEDFE